MHLCNPHDTHPCNSWCQGDTHVDLAYCDRDLVRELGIDPIEAFRHHHAETHATLYGTPPCTIMAMVLANEVPLMPTRYPQHCGADAPIAYRVTYQVHAVLTTTGEDEP